MIELIHITKRYPVRSGWRNILRGVNFKLEPGQKAGILGRNGSGKSTFVRIVAGAESPTTGTVRHGMRVSWPIAFSGGTAGYMTGLDNLKFICRVYGVDYKKALPKVEDFAELGPYMREPVRTYSSGMTARLSFALSMAIEFDCYLIDEVMAVGDKRFQDKCQVELFEKRADRSLILVSHVPGQIKKHCNLFFVMRDGILHRFEDIELATQFYEAA